MTNLFFILLQDSIEIRIECLFTELDKLQITIKQIDLFEKKVMKPNDVNGAKFVLTDKNNHRHIGNIIFTIFIY